jgi:hypothetical protein
VHRFKFSVIAVWRPSLIASATNVNRRCYLTSSAATSTRQIKGNQILESEQLADDEWDVRAEISGQIVQPEFLVGAISVDHLLWRKSNIAREVDEVIP